MREGKIDLGDFNGDGYADLLYSGILSGGIGEATRLSEFSPSSTSFIDSSFDVSDIIKAEVEFGDLDGDGDLDFSLSGESKANAGSYIFRTYINFRNESAKVIEEGGSSIVFAKMASQAYVVNLPPEIPLLNDIKSVEGGVINGKGTPVEFSWSAVTDDHTPVNGLTYALKIGTTSGGNQIMSANSNATGIRKTSEKGNMEHNLNWQLRLPIGKYYASIQSIDASNTGSKFSPEVEFEVTSSGVLLRIEDSMLDKSLKLFPNPFINSFSIQSEIPIQKVDIFSSIGVKIKEIRSNFNKIKTQNLAVGLYLVKIYSENGTALRKIIKK